MVLRAVFLVATAGLLFPLQSCQNEQGDPELEVPSTLSFTSSGGKELLAIKANCAWEIACDADWLLFSETAGNGDMTISVFAVPYENAGSRNAIASIKYDGGKKEISVGQEGAGAGLSVKDELFFPCDGAEKPIYITANCPWEIVNVADWLEVSQLTGEGNSRVTVKAHENVSFDARNATLEIKYDSQTQEIAVAQKGIVAVILNAEGGANSYLINRGRGRYAMNAVYKGNSTSDEIGDWAVAELLWQDTDGLVSGIMFNGTEKLLVADIADAEGNAVVCVKNSTGNILWSWHLWVVRDFNPAVTSFTSPAAYGNGSRWTFMDRHLGATVTTQGSPEAFGLIYQWGRKDPFTASAAATEQERTLYDIEGNRIDDFYARAAANGTIALSIANPMVFYTVSYETGDWHDTSSDDMWGGVSMKKTIYDPCPPGWKVPVCDAAGVTPYGFMDRNNTTWVNNGRLYNDTDWWFAGSGTRVNYSAELNINISGETYGGLWIGTHGKANSDPEFPALYGQYFFVGSGRLVSVGKDTRAQGMTVRCVAE